MLASARWQEVQKHFSSTNPEGLMARISDYLHPAVHVECEHVCTEAQHRRRLHRASGLLARAIRD